MAITVDYEYEYLYRYVDQDNRYPLLQIQLVNMSDPKRAFEVDAYLDSGAARSLFDGQLASAIGLDLMAGEQKRYSSTAGSIVWARLHKVRFEHPDLGSFQLEAGFSEAGVIRNLLGRDFFALVQIGFREKHSTFYLTSSP
jgi:hypothetical protein